MTDAVSDLVRALDEAIALLERSREEHWRNSLEHDRRLIQAHDARGLEHLLMAFGGMGSFNDLVLHRDNGHFGDDESLRAANDRLWDLRDDIYTAAKKVRQSP